MGEEGPAHTPTFTTVVFVESRRVGRGKGSTKKESESAAALDALRRMGYEAVTTAHNDVLVAERKVAGTACYTTPTGTVVHACMLYDVNMDALQQAITPTEAKLAKHAVASVRQRVINLREIQDLGPIEIFRRQLEDQLLNA